MLRPLEFVYRGLSKLRRWFLRRRFGGRQYAAPVIVIGNIAVGGSGKTPLLMALVMQLRLRGFKPGVVSHGYGGEHRGPPIIVDSEGAASIYGDEPLLIARQCACPVVVGANRDHAVRMLLANFDCNLVLSDDGLQHYAMPRTVEVAVVDGSRLFGNGYCLPAGPLRESIARLSTVDFVAINGPITDSAPEILAGAQAFCLKPVHFINLRSGQQLPVEEWSGTSTVHAVAAIGAPERFAATLESLGLDVILHPYADHAALTLDALRFPDDLDVIITAKDAVKLSSRYHLDIWCLEVVATFDEAFVDRLVARL